MSKTIKTFIVLGMHRSATSLVAEGMHKAEIYMGKDRDSHWEDWDFGHINRQILNIAGGNWANIPSRKKILTAGDKLKNKIKRLVEKNNSKYEYWGWKDPRTTLTIECFMPYLINPIFFVCFRNPKDVAKSLVVRSPGVMTIQRGLNIYKTYNERLFNFLRRYQL